MLQMFQSTLDLIMIIYYQVNYSSYDKFLLADLRLVDMLIHVPNNMKLFLNDIILILQVYQWSSVANVISFQKGISLKEVMLVLNIERIRKKFNIREKLIWYTMMILVLFSAYVHCSVIIKRIYETTYFDGEIEVKTKFVLELFLTVANISSALSMFYQFKNKYRDQYEIQKLKIILLLLTQGLIHLYACFYYAIKLSTEYELPL